MSMPPTPVDVCADTCLPGSTMHIRNVGIARMGLAGETTSANSVGDIVWTLRGQNNSVSAVRQQTPATMLTCFPAAMR